MVGPTCRIGLIAAVLGAVLIGSACGREPTLSQLSGVEAFREQFNEDAGKPRIVLLLSPT